MEGTPMEDVVVRKYLGGRTIQDYGRDTLAVAKEFCRRPKYPAKLTDSFIAVDDWGHGTIVAATPDLSNWIGKSYSQFRREVH
jgi:hypothetical protein